VASTGGHGQIDTTQAIADMEQYHKEGFVTT